MMISKHKLNIALELLQYIQLHIMKAEFVAE